MITTAHIFGAALAFACLISQAGVLASGKEFCGPEKRMVKGKGGIRGFRTEQRIYRPRPAADEGNRRCFLDCKSTDTCSGYTYSSFGNCYMKTIRSGAVVLDYITRKDLTSVWCELNKDKAPAAQAAVQGRIPEATTVASGICEAGTEWTVEIADMKGPKLETIKSSRGPIDEMVLFCTDECKRRKGCRSIVYNTRNGKCYLKAVVPKSSQMNKRKKYFRTGYCKPTRGVELLRTIAGAGASQAQTIRSEASISSGKDVCTRNTLVGDLSGTAQVTYKLKTRPTSNEAALDECFSACLDLKKPITGKPCVAFVYFKARGLCYLKPSIPTLDNPVDESAKRFITGWVGGKCQESSPAPRTTPDKSKQPQVQPIKPVDRTKTKQAKSTKPVDTKAVTPSKPVDPITPIVVKPLDCDHVWKTGVEMPVMIGEVSSVAVGDNIYSVGEGAGVTVKFNTITQQLSLLPNRTYEGHHHAVVTAYDKMYLIGGLGEYSMNRLQIFDPETEEWIRGANLPYDSGSGVASFDGDDTIYSCGGIDVDVTVERCSTYSIRDDTWTEITETTSMIPGRNHQAYATSNTQMFAVGGRSGGNTLGDAFVEATLFDMTTRQWSTLPSIPYPRGGCSGVAYKGSFFVMGGEIRNSQCADIAAVTPVVWPKRKPGCTVASAIVHAPSERKEWRNIPSLPSARHGMGAVEVNGSVYIIGGGPIAANSQSNTIFYASLDDLLSCKS